MYRFSRSIYRELAVDINDGKPATQVESNHQRVLRHCEQAMERLATDRRYFAKPARSLFNDVRIYFPIQCHYRVFRVIERYVHLALEYLEEKAEEGLGFDGSPLRCRATTRKGKPCQRMPLPGNQYCPSHQHLAEPLETAATV